MNLYGVVEQMSKYACLSTSLSTVLRLVLGCLVPNGCRCQDCDCDAVPSRVVVHCRRRKRCGFKTGVECGKIGDGGDGGEGDGGDGSNGGAAGEMGDGGRPW